MSELGFTVGQRVRVKANWRNGWFIGAEGVIASLSSADGTAWVRFEPDGAEGLFDADELEHAEPAPAAPAPSVEGDAATELLTRLYELWHSGDIVAHSVTGQMDGIHRLRIYLEERGIINERG